MTDMASSAPGAGGRQAWANARAAAVTTLNEWKGDPEERRKLEKNVQNMEDRADEIAVRQREIDAAPDNGRPLSNFEKGYRARMERFLATILNNVLTDLQCDK